MAGLQVLSAPTNQPNLTGVVNAPAGVPTGPLPVVNKPANVPAKLPVVSAPANVQPSISVQPLPQQPSIYVPPKPPEPPQLDKIASDIGVARSRGADDTTILYTLVKKNPALTQDVKVAIQERKATPTQVLDAIVAKHAPQPPEQPGFWKGLGQDIARTPIQIVKSVAGLIDAAESKITKDPEKAAMLEKRAIDTFTSPTFGETPKYTVTEGLGKGLEIGSYFVGGGGAKNVGGAIVKQGLKQAAIQGLKSGAEVGLVSGLGRGLQAENPTIGSVTTTAATDTLAGGLFGLVTGAGGYGVKTGAQKVLSAISPTYKSSNLADKFEQTVQEGFSKGVKPSVNSTADKKAVEAVATIIDNKATVLLPDKDGNLVSRLPKNNQEFADAIGQVKKSLFQRYNFLNKAANDTGAKIELSPVAERIERVINAPEIRDVRPDVYNYGKKFADTLRQRGVYSLEDSQDVIAALNSDAQGFFKNLNATDKPKGALAASIAETLRKVQSKTIQSLNGAGGDWVHLRRQYGALESVEKDVLHRALVQARRGPVSIFDLFQAGNAGDVARILVGDFSGAAKGLISGTVTRILKNANDPDKIIAKMFKEAGKLGDSLSEINGSILPKVRPAIPSQLALPAPKTGSPKASVNVPINQPPKIIRPAILAESKPFIGPRSDFAPKAPKPLMLPGKGQTTTPTMNLPSRTPSAVDKPFIGKGALSRINNYLNEVTPGLYTKSKYTVTYTTDEGKKAVLKNLTRDEARGWLQWLEENGLKYSVKAAGVVGVGYAVKEGSKR